MTTLLFFSVCVPVRVGIIIGALFIPRVIGAVLAFVGAAGFTVQHLLGRPGAAGQRVWWSRPFHAITYAMAGIAFLVAPRWVPALILGLDLVAGVAHYLSNRKLSD